METKVNEIHKPFLQTLGEGMIRAQQEIDLLALQLSLGKAEANDTFEEIKSDFRKHVTSLKQLLSSKADKSIPVDVKLKVEALDLQLQLGKVVSRKSFETQREALIASTIALENEIMNALQKIKVSHSFHLEAEKFLLKLEILRLKFGIKKFEIKESFRTGMTCAAKAIDKVTRNMKEAGTIATRQMNYRKEIITVYKHMKRAVKNL